MLYLLALLLAVSQAAPATSNSDDAKVAAICEGDVSEQLRLVCDQLAEQRNETIKIERELVYPKCRGLLDQELRELCIQLEIAKGTQALNLTQVEDEYDINDVPPILERNNTVELPPVAKGKGKGKGRPVNVDLLGGLDSIAQQLENSGIVTSLQTIGNDAVNLLGGIDTSKLATQFSDFLTSKGLAVANSPLADVSTDQVQGFVDKIGATNLVDNLGRTNTGALLNAGIKLIEIWRANKFAMSDAPAAQPLKDAAQRINSVITNTAQNEVALNTNPLGTKNTSAFDGPVQLGKLDLTALNKAIGKEIKNQGLIQKLQDIWAGALSGN